MNTPRPSNRDTRTFTPLPALHPPSSIVSDLDPPVRPHSALHSYENLTNPATLTPNLTHARHILCDLKARVSTLEASMWRTYRSISGPPTPQLSPPLPEHIQRFHDEEGRPYYVNHLTQTTSWENPLKGKGKEDEHRYPANHATRMTSWQSPRLTGEAGERDDTDIEGEVGQREGEGEGENAHDTRTQPTYRPRSPSLPPHVTRDLDEHGRPYYLNHRTRTTSWCNPLHRLPTPRPSYRHPANPAPYSSDPASHVISHPSRRHPASHPPVASSSASTEPPLPPHLAIWHDSVGRAFYADRATGTTSWLHPSKVEGALARKRKWRTDEREVTVDGRGVYWVDYESGGVTGVVALEGMEGRWERRERREEEEGDEKREAVRISIEE